jgi:hypothetical protein
VIWLLKRENQSIATSEQTAHKVAVEGGKNKALTCNFGHRSSPNKTNIDIDYQIVMRHFYRGAKCGAKQDENRAK